MTQRHRPFLIANFTFHNVGQGLFYSSNIDDFRFVYDCGSTRRRHLSSIVSKFKKNYFAPAIMDLLVLSHLHDDHIAGLNDLLKRPQISIDLAVLPYLFPIERLIVALTKISLPKWFYKFWSDPVQFLIENGVKQVMLLGGSEPTMPKDDLTPERRMENETERLNLNEMFDDDKLRREIMEKDGQWKKFLGQGRLLVKSHDGLMFSRVPHGAWVFRFFNCRVKDSNLSQFERCIKPMAGRISLTKIIRSRSKLRQLKKCYNLLHKDFNNTSIVVYHAPVLHTRRNFSHPNNYGGHLLVGDVDFNQKLTEICTHFGFMLPKLSFCLVPHHGARRNWNKAVLTKVSGKCQWVISSGIANRYGHPSFNVVKDITQNGNPLYWSNEVNEISTMMFF